ncbi:MAG: Na+/glucose cotransporter, partial [Verrucomicrobia bacterium]|nr:Na+/glucose cotransporter [Verrucomicrobiota bacterium]
FTVDLYEKFRPSATQHEIVRMGRIATVAMVVIGFLWIPVIKGSKGLYFYLQAMQGYLAPPIFTVFFLGVFMKRLNSKGCLAALIVGFALGLFRLAVDTPIALGMAGFENGYPAGSLLWIVNNIYFQYFSILIFLVCVAVMVVVSYATEPPSEEKIRGLTFATTTSEQHAASRASWNRWDVIASAVVVLLIVMAYLYFRG